MAEQREWISGLFTELCHAATKIQASFRGHMARKQVPATKGKPEDDLSKELQKLDAKTEEEELADINLNDPDLHKAATVIQATFRRRLMMPTKPRPSEKTEEDELADIDLRDPDLHKAASIIQSTFRRSKARQIQPAAAKTEEDELADLDLNDPELHKAASKIQATFRKRMLPAKSSRPELHQLVAKTQGDDDELADIDLNDPELHKAASKIQATFRRRVVPVKESH